MEKILIIDDDEMDLQFMNVLFSSEGYEVVKTADGPQGVDLYKKHSPKFVFLDLGLPSANGMEVLKEIKRFDESAKVVLITGYGSEKVAKNAFQLGALDFIEKRWDVGSMMDRIKSVLNAHDPGKVAG
ncbi:MAG TPA: response regulator [Bacteroidota bacterium]|nr:response regulator [Bacteroidota bacterium]